MMTYFQLEMDTRKLVKMESQKFQITSSTMRLKLLSELPH